MIVSTPSASHSRDLFAHLLHRADEPAGPERAEIDAVHHARGRLRRHAIESPLQIALVLTAQRVETE